MSTRISFPSFFSRIQLAAGACPAAKPVSTFVYRLYADAKFNSMDIYKSSGSSKLIAVVTE